MIYSWRTFCFKPKYCSVKVYILGKVSRQLFHLTVCLTNWLKKYSSVRHFLAHSILPTYKGIPFGGFEGLKFTLLPQIMPLDVSGERARLYLRSLPWLLITFAYSLYIVYRLQQFRRILQIRRKTNEYTERNLHLNNAWRIKRDSILKILVVWP
jgi:hypothetical protein